MSSLTVADVLAQALKAAEIDTVFGLPGGENVAIIDALQRNNIRFVLVHNESSAIYMADVYGQIQRKIGVALTTLGPGLLNAFAGLGHAYVDRSAVLLISAAVDDSLRPHHTHQYVDQLALTTPITKFSKTLTPANVAQTMVDALAAIPNGRPGPVHLQLSKQTAILPVTQPPVAPLAKPATRPHQPTQLTDAQALIAAAKKPILIVGLGIEPQHPYTDLRTCAEALHAPVIMSPKAKGAIPADHPLCAGTVGLMRDDPVYELLAEADCYIAVGFDVGELVRPWDEDGSFIWIADWDNADPVLPTNATLVGDIGQALQALSTATAATNADWGAARVARFQQAHLLPPTQPSATGRMWPQTVLAAIRDNTPRTTYMATDVGAHKGLTALTWPAYMPNRYFVSNGLSSMGFGIPAAIAASMATPATPSVVIMGDGGMAMIVGELALLSGTDYPVLVVVMVDSALDLIRSAQRKSGHDVCGTEFIAPDFVQIANAYGIAARDVTDYATCAAAVQAAIASQKPMLIAAHIDPSSYPSQPKQK